MPIYISITQERMLLDGKRDWVANPGSGGADLSVHG